MKTLQGLKFGLTLVVLFLTISIQAQTVVYDDGTPRRPIAVNGYTFDGVTYNITITYSTIIDGTITSGFSQADAGMIASELRDLLNTQIPKSDPTEFYIVTGDSDGFFGGCNINFTDGGPWSRNCSSPSLAIDQPVNPAKGITSFQVAPPNQPLPTFNQWGLIIFAMLMLTFSLFFVYKQ